MAELINNRYIINPIRKNNTKINSYKQTCIISKNIFKYFNHQLNVSGGQSYLPILFMDSYKNSLILLSVVLIDVFE